MKNDDKTVEERLSALEERAGRGEWVSAYESDLRKTALSYATLAKFGYVIEKNGTKSVFGPSEVAGVADYLTRRMQQIAVELLGELSRETPIV